MSKKLKIEIDEFGNTKVFVNDEEIGANGKMQLIDTVTLYSKVNEQESKVEINFYNLFSGLTEGTHKEVAAELKRSIKLLDGLPVNTSMGFLLNHDRLFENILGKENG